MKTTIDQPEGKSKRIFWSLLFLVLAAMSVWAVTSQSKGFSPKKFVEYVKYSNPWWLTAAFLAMLAYIAFDAMRVRCLLRGFRYPKSAANCISYAAADIYFSAITPSATGGQPMEAYFMVKDGVPVIMSTVIMLTYLFFYTLCIVIIGLVCLILAPGAFMSFSVTGRIFIGVGAVIQVALAIFYGMLLWNKGMIYGILRWGLRVLAKLHLVRKLDEKEAKLKATMEQYEQATEMLKGHRGLMVKTLLLNMAHRVSQIMVTVFCFLAGGGSLKLAPKLFAMQSDVVIGSCCIPIPGSMGVTDYLMIDGFSSMMTEQQSANLELLARATSFYICILLCGLIVLVKSATLKFRKTEPTADTAAAVEAEAETVIEAVSEDSDEAAEIITEAVSAGISDAET
ncbi:MAG: flippase-like domain-containing protein [Lachnospiraceae bacterium]|nr:flippase-like domain-containing protein [Lachnospiraceae bacterium]